MENVDKKWSQCLVSDGEHISVEQHIYSQGNTGYHFHNEYEFEILLSGEANMYVDDKIMILKDFDYYILPAGKLHKITINEKPTVFFDVLFDIDVMSNAVKNVLQCMKYPICGKISDGLADYIGFGIDIYGKAKEKMTDNDMYSRMIINAVENVLLYVLQNCDDSDAITRYGEINRDKTFFGIIEYVNKNYTERITNKYLSKKFGITPNYLGRRFAYYTGKKVSDYVNDLRIELAYKKLRMTEMSIDEIAHEVGFESMAYFYNVFKRRYDMTPKEIRKDDVNFN